MRGGGFDSFCNICFLKLDIVDDWMMVRHLKMQSFECNFKISEPATGLY